MGIVRKQSIASSIYIYLGFAVGAFNVLYLFPTYLTPQEFGLTRVLIDVSIISVSLKDSQKTGVDWSKFSLSMNSTSTFNNNSGPASGHFFINPVAGNLPSR